MNAFRQIRWVALIVSWVVDIGGSNVFAAVYFGALAAVGRLTLAQLSSPDFEKIILNDPVLFAMSMAGGTFFSVLAGYVAARIAGRAPRFSTERFLRPSASAATSSLFRRS